jgi:hypothetical protein
LGLRGAARRAGELVDRCSERPVASGLLVAWGALLASGLLPPQRLFATQDEGHPPVLFGQRWSPYTASQVERWVPADVPRGQSWSRRTSELAAEVALLTRDVPHESAADPTVVEGTAGMLLCGRTVRVVLVRPPGSASPAVTRAVEVTC